MKSLNVDDRLNALEAEVEELRELLSSVAGQLLGSAPDKPKKATAKRT